MKTNHPKQLKYLLPISTAAVLITSSFALVKPNPFLILFALIQWIIMGIFLNLTINNQA
jgi:hypothetical protein